MDYVEELVKLAMVRRPVEQPNARDWKAAESEIGLALPSDFKALVTALGSGDFGVGLFLRNPRSSSEYARLCHSALVSYQERLSTAAQRSSIRLYPMRRGLVEIAGVDRQNFLFRPDKTGKRLCDLVWWDVDYEKAVNLGMSISQFIHSLYFGRLEESWAENLRNYFWGGGAAPFFRGRLGASRSEA